MKIPLKLELLLKRVVTRFLSDPGVILQQRVFQEFTRARALNREFPVSFFLPKDYGKGLPERVVEILLARLSYAAGLRVLDVGHANAMKCHLDMLLTLDQPRRIKGIDIVRPVYDPRPCYDESVLGDATNMPFGDASFDLVWCVSAMEHFGMDNSNYASNFRREEVMDQRALREMLRVLAVGGHLLLTVPYGRYETHGWLRNYDEVTWQALLAIARSQGSVTEWYFRHTWGEGWRIVRAEELEHVGYYDQANSGSGGLAVAFVKREDFQ